MFDWIRVAYSASVSFLALCFTSTANAFWGKTELELGGIEVIREAAEILAQSINSFPSKSTAIALIGLIIVSQATYLLSKGCVNLLCYRQDPSLRRSGIAQCLIGLLFFVCGAASSLYSIRLANWLFK